MGIVKFFEIPVFYYVIIFFIARKNQRFLFIGEKSTFLYFGDYDKKYFGLSIL